MDDKTPKFDRRQIIRTILIGGVATTLILPGKWTKPLVNSVIVPAHAQASPPVTTSTTTSTTGAPTSTTSTTTTTEPPAEPTAE